MATHSSSMTLAMMAYLVILYDHLYGCTLANVIEEHCASSVLPSPYDVMLGNMTSTFCRLDILL